MKILSVFGTRPEAIKLAPVIKKLQQTAEIESIVCVTGQHRQMLDQMLDFFEINVDYDLDLMQPNQSLTMISSQALIKLEQILTECQPDWVLVQGDTTTAFISSLAAFYQKIDVAHVEAGLRTNNIYSPWPEELNRRLIGGIAKLHFAPTQGSANNLISEAVSADQVSVPGNTVIDALLLVVERFKTDQLLQQEMQKKFPMLDDKKRMILVTCHRRENHDGGIANVCKALKRIAMRGDVTIVYPVHLNPKVQKPVNEELAGIENVHLISPQDYLPFVYLLSKCTLVITDSGGVQEEAPTLGKPILVARNTTERPEGVSAGNAILVGTDCHHIVEETNRLLDDAKAYQEMSLTSNPYGDGQASEKIVTKMLEVAQISRNNKELV